MKKHILILLLSLSLPVFANAEVLIQGSVDWGISGIDGIIFPMPFDHEILVMYEFPELGRFSVAAGGGVIFPFGVFMPALSTDMGFKLFETENYDFSIHWELAGGMIPFPTYYKDDDGNEILRYTHMYANTALLASWHWSKSKLYVQTGPSYGLLRLHNGLGEPEFFNRFGIRSVFGIRL